VDPSNENRLYRLASSIDVSQDGGRTFETVVPSRVIHGDVHELWIHPADPGRMIMGNDGGIAFTYDGGKAWRFVENLPLAQFYHINVDMEVPFNVYGGLQDNGSWFGPSQVWEDMGIMNAHWRRTGGGDGFASLPDFSDARYGYSMSQQGSLMRFDKVTGERRDIQPIHPDGTTLRFNWNAALNVDPHDSTTLYLGSQFVHRSRDGGMSWEIISPDLTSNDPGKQRQDVSGGLTLDATGAENHTTILSIAPSPLMEGLIWVSTDDGRVQRTLDGGETWRSVEERIPGVPAATYAPHVEPSKHDPDVAYVVFDDHRRGNWATYVFRTEDLGESWSLLNLDGVQGFAHVVEEDPEEPNLLFLGTEFGLWVSLDRGRSWVRWTSGLPAVPVRALMVHPRDHDLVVGTHGRAAYILDDIRPLRSLARDGVPGPGEVRLFQPPPAYQVTIAERIGYRSYGHAMFFGENRPYGALLTFWADSEHRGDSASFRILSSDGIEVARFSRPVLEGMNRFAWDLRKEEVEGSGGGFRGGGPLVLPGEYTVELTLGESTALVELSVHPDPRRSIPLEDRRAKLEALEEVSAWVALAREGEDRLREALSAVEGVLASPQPPEDPDLATAAQTLREDLNGALERLFSGPSCQGICGGNPLVDTVRRPVSLLGSSLEAPSANDRLAMRQAQDALAELVGEVNRILREEIGPFQARLQAAGYSPFPSLETIGMGDGTRRDGE
jgi:photosystem II stability/assembly factor-like uncharacterized protein